MNASWRGRAGTYPESRRTVAVPGIHCALDGGVRLLDTADVYAPRYSDVGHNEYLIAEARDTWPGSTTEDDPIIIATKGGVTRHPGEKWGKDASLSHLLTAATTSAVRLGVDRLDLYQHHRLAEDLTFETQIENLLQVKKHGLTEHIGVSNYSAEQLRVALELVGGPADGGIVSLQNPWSPFYPADSEVVELCEKEGIAFLAWGPLGGKKGREAIDQGALPEFDEIARFHHVSTPALIVAWLLHLSASVIVVSGATRPETVSDTLGALTVSLRTEEVTHLSAHLPQRQSPGYGVDTDPAPPWRMT
jgi:aryl-alcohol dehydrogenase-like predicted oxidoreductase